MLNIIAWILAIISIIIILSIIIRKFPALSILNVEDIPGRKESKFKDEIMRQRVARDFKAIADYYLKAKRFLGDIFRGFIERHQERLEKMRDHLRRQKKMSLADRRAKIEKLFIEVEQDFSAEKLEEAEHKLIEIISLDAKRLSAFWKLAEVYRLRKSYQEAKQTLEHAWHLAKQLGEDAEHLGGVALAEIHFSLAWICNELDLDDQALEYAHQAVEAEPNNPRYLDLILDLSIMKKDKKTALDAWEKLAAANPENSKLPEWKEKIDSLE